ncbi:Non-catalytic module family DOC2, partial [Piromyces sp. E2]
CWAIEEGYSCCNPGTPVYLTDSKGKWGYVNNEWCGIVENKDDGSVKAQGFKCCSTTCESIYTDGNGRWGVENGQWCGIIESQCK